MRTSRSIGVLEQLAEQTWNQIQASEELGLPFGEETITEVNNLAIRSARLSELLVFPVSKRKEAIYGLDWMWYVGNSQAGWWKYAVQAKRIHQTRTYPKLRYKVGRRLQSSILREFALKYSAIPLYCLYNYEPTLASDEAWNCSLPFVREQLGCTLIPLDLAVVFGRKGSRSTFRDVHACETAIPWRCILTCPGLNPEGHGYVHPLASKGFGHIRSITELPSAIGSALRQPNSYDPIILDGEDAQIAPRHVMVINTGDR